MSKVTLPLAMLLLLLIATCRKPEIETIRIRGHVTDARSTQALESVNLTLQSAVLEGGIFHNNFEDVASSATDASGAYSFETETEKAVKYRITVMADGYFSESEDFDPFDVTQEEDYIADFSIDPQAWLYLEIANTNPWDQYDQVTWSFQGTFRPCSDCCAAGIRKGVGPIFTYDGYCRLPGEQWMLISWAVTKNGNTINHNDSIWISSFDTIPYTIHY